MNGFHSNLVSNVSYRNTHQNPTCHKSFVSQSQDLSFSSGSNQVRSRLKSEVLDGSLTSSWSDLDLYSLLPQLPDVSRINLTLPLCTYKPQLRSETYHPSEMGFAGRSSSECGSVGDSSVDSDLSDNHDRRMGFQPVFDDCVVIECMQEGECQYKAVYRKVSNVSNSHNSPNFVEKKNAPTCGFIRAMDLIWFKVSGHELARSEFVHAQAYRSFQVGETYLTFLLAFNRFAPILAASHADVSVTCQQQKVGKDDSHVSKKHATVTVQIFAPAEVMEQFDYYLGQQYESTKHQRKNCFQQRNHVSTYTNLLLHTMTQLNLDFQTGVPTRAFKVQDISQFIHVTNMLSCVDRDALKTNRVKVAFMMENSGNATKGKGNSQPSFKYLVICYNAPSYISSGKLQNLEQSMYRIDDQNETVVTRFDKQQFEVFYGLFTILRNLYGHQSLKNVGKLEVGGFYQSSRVTVQPSVQHSQYTEDAQEVIKTVNMIISLFLYVPQMNIEIHNRKNTGSVEYRVWVVGLQPCPTLTTYKFVNQHHVAGLFKPEKQKQALKVYKELFSNSRTELFKKQFVRWGATAL